MGIPFLLNYLGLAILGAALLWAARLVYGERRAGGEDVIRRCLLLAGWILLLGGTIVAVVAVTGPFALLFLLALVVFEGSYCAYIQSEQRALLWALGIAADKGIPLEQAARALADERSLQIGSRVTRLAELLEAGAPLPQALPLSGNPLPADAVLAARIGTATGQLGPAVHIALDHHERFERIFGGALGPFVYVLYTCLIGSFILTFVMLKIVPVYTRMFAEFGLKLPAMTQLLITCSQFVVNTWFLFAPFLCAAGLLVCLAELSYHLHWTRYDIPGFGRLWLRCDRALIMRTLAYAAGLQRDVAGTITLLAHAYPRPGVGRRLERAADQVARGVPWCDALSAERLLSQAERAVLRAAERIGNLPWALEELADSTARRFAMRLRVAVDLLLPVVVLIMGVVVLFIFVGLFLPLVSMIQGLS